MRSMRMLASQPWTRAAFAEKDEERRSWVGSPREGGHVIPSSLTGDEKEFQYTSTSGKFRLIVEFYLLPRLSPCGATWDLNVQDTQATKVVEPIVVEYKSSW